MTLDDLSLLVPSGLVPHKRHSMLLIKYASPGECDEYYITEHLGGDTQTLHSYTAHRVVLVQPLLSRCNYRRLVVEFWPFNLWGPERPRSCSLFSTSIDSYFKNQDLGMNGAALLNFYGITENISLNVASLRLILHAVSKTSSRRRPSRGMKLERQKLRYEKQSWYSSRHSDPKSRRP